MSITITIKDKNKNTLLFGQVHDCSVNCTGDMKFTLVKIHAPIFSQEEYTWDGFKVPKECACDVCTCEPEPDESHE